MFIKSIKYSDIVEFKEDYMDLLPSERPKFTIEDSRDASTSDDAELDDDSNSVNEMMKKPTTNAVDADGDTTLNDDASPMTLDVDGVTTTDADENDKTERKATDSDTIANNNSNGNAKVGKVKTPNRTAISYTQHIPTLTTDIIEYEWPEKSSDFYFVQEQISQLLDVKSFKRKYPDLARHNIEPDEREYLVKHKQLTSLLPVHLLNNLTALRSVEVLDLMSVEYPAIHAEYQKIVFDRRKNALIEKQKELDLIKLDTKKLEELRKKAIKSAAKFNHEQQTAKRVERAYFYDTQTSIVQSARNRWARLSADATRPSAYPVALIAGQFASHYRKFTADEIMAMPLNTIVENDNLFVPRRERSPSPIHVPEGLKPDKKQILQSANNGLNANVGEESNTDAHMTEEIDTFDDAKVVPLKPGRRLSTTSNGTPTPKRPRKASAISNKALLAESIAAMTSTKTEIPISPIMKGPFAGYAAQLQAQRQQALAQQQQQQSPHQQRYQAHAKFFVPSAGASNAPSSLLLQSAGNENASPRGSTAAAGAVVAGAASNRRADANDVDVANDDDNQDDGQTAIDNDDENGDNRCIVCNLRETDVPPHALAADLGRSAPTRTPFVRCADCAHRMHAGCIDMSAGMVDVVRTYEWRCAECKECSVCGKPDQEEAMMCCDLCDRGYHTFCIGISTPPTDQFICVKCTK